MIGLNIPLVVFGSLLTSHHYARGFPLLSNQRRIAAAAAAASGFNMPKAVTLSSSTTSSSLHAKPQRLAENAPGVVYVNDQCINCAACSNFAPDTFSRSKQQAAHIVHRQPVSPKEIHAARQALAACPVAAIRLETLAQKRHDATSTSTDKQAVQDAWTEQDQQLLEQMSGKQSSSSSSDKKAAPLLFPRPFLDNVPDVYWLGHHNSKSFGATPYLLRVPNNNNKKKNKTARATTTTTTNGDDENHSNNDNRDHWIMIDTPKFSKSAVQAVTSLTGPAGPDYLFLTHVDDTADHNKWVEHFYNFQPSSSSNNNNNSNNQSTKKSKGLQRIFHAGDLGKHNWLNDKTLEQVEILLQPPEKEQKTNNDSFLTAYSLEGNILPDTWMTQTTPDELPVVILHTPGHSPGSITLYRRPLNANTKGIIFTGDTYAYTTRTNSMTSFPQYGNNHRQQADTIQRLMKLDWSLVAPGHGLARDYRGREQDRVGDMQPALNELLQPY